MSSDNTSMDTGPPNLPNEADQYWSAAGKPRLARLCAGLTGVPTHRRGLSQSQIAACCDALDTERRAIRRVLCQLDASHNDLQPVNSLPSEILTHIFKLIVERHQIKRIGRRHMWATDFFSLELYGLARVCRRWRTEALACRSLWTNLATSMLPVVLRNSVKRSQDASLSVVTDHYRQRTGLPERLAIVLSPEVLDRARHLSLVYGAFKRGFGGSLEPLTRPMHRLESFEYHRESSFGGSLGVDDGNLPGNLFSGIAPRLVRFTVEYPSSFPHFPDLFKQLRSLCLKTLQHLDFAHPSFHDVFNVLDLMADLESLELTNTLPITSPPPRRSTQLIRPRLKRIVLEGPMLSCTCIIREFRVTADCAINLTCNASGDAASSMTDLLDALDDTGIKNISPFTLSAFSGSTGSLHVAVYRETYDDINDVHGVPSGFSPSEFAFFPDDPPLLNIRVEGLDVADNSVMPVHIASIYTRFLSLEELVLLSIHVDMGECNVTGGPTASSELRQLWTVALKPCSQLRVVHCAGAAAYTLLRELASSHESEPQLLPALDHLCFDSDRISRDLLYEGVSIYDLLLNALQHRKIPHTKICDRQPLLYGEGDEDEVAILRQHTDLWFFERLYGEDSESLGDLPDHFFEYGPNVVEVGADDDGA
ncbi:unnamed protein product [Peniophora sp. CBMAI 1063]|nr:unnamed protein product [Peniophora sp. CBMAI 1063]